MPEFYTPGHQFYAMFAPEVAGITEGVGTAEPTLPAVPTAGLTLIGQINPSDILEDDGDEKGYSAGASQAVYDQEKGRIYESTITQRVTSLALAARCVPAAISAGAPYGLPMSALFYGTSASADVYRMSVCNQFSGEFSEGSGSELSVTSQMWSVYKDSATVTPPTATDLRTLGAPASWHDLSSFTIDGTYRRKELAGVSWTQNHNLERKGFRPWYVGAGLKASRATYELLPHHINGSGEFRFHSRFNTTTNDWGDVVMTIGATTWTFVNVHVSQRRQPGIESSGQLGWTVPFQFDYMTIA